MENCALIHSRGFFFVCDHHAIKPSSSCPTVEPSLIKTAFRPGDSLYICNSALPDFIQNYLPLLSVPFVLVSGDSDVTIPDFLSQEEVQTILSSPVLLKWFCQNCVIRHPKIELLPIGLDYHTLKPGEVHPWGVGLSPKQQENQLFQIRNSPDILPFWKRKLACYSNFHHTVFGIGYRGDRKQVVAEVPDKLVFYEPGFTDRFTSWIHQKDYAFVLSPQGGGLDCHRTWEALILGCIPIVKSSGLDPLYEGLPVMIVTSWKDITKEKLIQTLLHFRTRAFQYEKLNLSYWTQKINTFKDEINTVDV
jgi:hypothetical protein